MSETTALPPVTERGFINLMITGYVYPMTMLPVTPLLGIYRSGKETYRFLEGTLFGSNDLVRIGVTILATPFVALFMLWPFGILEGTELISDQVARLGLDKAVERTIQGVADTVFGTIGSLLPKE